MDSHNKMEIDIPANFICPITSDIMKEPYICIGDNITYERSAVEAWFSKNDTSPITNKKIDKTLIPNLAMKNTINEWLAEQKGNPRVNSMSEQKKPDHVVYGDIVFRYNTMNKDKQFFLLESEENKQRKPIFLVTVIDVSGSMDTLTKLGETDNGFTRLDLVKHAMKTIIHTLDENDILVMIKFASNAVCIFNNKLTKENKNEALRLVKNLYAEGYTNIWDGLNTAINAVTRSVIDEGTNKAIFLLTDGVPYGSLTTEQILENFAQTQTSKNLSNIMISTAGFGYTLDIKLLTELANEGNGNYLYIPDISMMGTVIVNYLANVLSIKLCKTDLSIRFGDKIINKNINMIQYGQKKFFSTDSNDSKEYYNLDLLYTLQQNTDTINDDASIKEYLEQLDCVFTISRLMRCIDREISLSHILRELQELNDRLTSQTLKRDLFSKLDSEGQISKAFENYDKWGMYYLPTFIRAHQLQQRNNFKDVSIQNYGGSLFKQLATSINDMYNSLPIDAPSALSQNSIKVYNMSSLNNYDNGCFDGNGLVDMANGQKKKVSNLKKNDVVKSYNGTTASVVCVTVKEVVNYFDIVKLGDKKRPLIITPYHPVRVNNEWKFPYTIAKSEECSEDLSHVYNLVLNQSHTVFINGIECVTLGHGFTDDIVAHDYFGTSKVIEDLESIEGWEDGLVNLNGFTFVRDKETGLIAGLTEIEY